MKKILMLGGSAQQVPAIEAAKKLGYYTVLIDYLPDNPGQFVADKWYQTSTTDIEAVYEIARKEEVSGILPYASDPAALPAAIVAERLNLPTNPAKSVEILGVKHKFRKFLQDNGFAAPKAFSFKIADSIGYIQKKCRELKFPIVVKPTDSSGSKGVSFLQNIDDLHNAIQHAADYSRNEILIAEEYIERGFPYVIGGDIFVEDGQIVLFGDMACLRDSEGNGLIPVGKKKPNGLNDVQTQLLHQELQRLVDALDIKNGELNIELIIDGEGRPHFLELGPRAGGNMIPIQLSDIYSVDLVSANVKAAMGEKVDLKIKESNKNYFTYVLHSYQNGVFSQIEYSPEIKEHIYRKVEYKKEGDKVEYFDGAGKALGIVFLKFDGEGEMIEAINNISQHIKVVLK